MTTTSDIRDHVLVPRYNAKAMAGAYRERGAKLVFTNGCFDILHVGHVRFLTEARQLGDRLIIGLNSDRSIRKLKGKGRPIFSFMERAEVLSALWMVDKIVMFNEDEPAKLIQEITPHVLVKGADWAHYVSGREWVESHGGKVVLLPLTGGASSSMILDRLRKEKK